MKSRIPLIVAVVGALLIGGATTGTTRASWSESVTRVGDGITTGTMNFTLGSPSPMSDLTKTVGSQSTATFVATDTGTGKNLTQRITAQVAGAPAGVTAYVGVGTTCPSVTSTSVFVDKKPTDTPRTATYCVRAVVTNASTASSGNVTLNLLGAQRPSGWSVPTKTVTLPITVAGFTCGSQSTKDVRPFSWTAVTGATGYTITYSSTQNGVYGNATNVGAAVTSHTVTLTSAQVRWFKVTASTASGSVSIPGILRMEREGNSGNSNMLCSVVTS